MSDKILKGGDFGESAGVADSLEFGLSGTGGLVKGEVLEALLEAREILKKARQEAAVIVEEAHQTLARAEHEKEEERNRGFAEGHEAGASELVEKVFDLEERREQMLNNAESDLVHMVMDIAQKVIGTELKKGAVVDVVKKTIAETLGQRLEIHVHPTDLPGLKRKEKQLLKLLDTRQVMTLKEDESVAPGGCLIETELGTIDARLEVQMAAIRKGLGIS